MASDAGTKTTYHLYTFYASSCAARLRIAFNLKNIDYIPHYVDMQNDGHESDTYRALNPSASIPTLVIETEGGEGQEPTTFTVGQTVAVLEYRMHTEISDTPNLECWLT